MLSHKFLLFSILSLGGIAVVVILAVVMVRVSGQKTGPQSLDVSPLESTVESGSRTIQDQPESDSQFDPLDPEETEGDLDEVEVMTPPEPTIVMHQPEI